MIRARMRFTGLTTRYFNNGGDGDTVVRQCTAHFDTIYDPAIEADRRFMQATPSGSAQFTIDNEVALESLQPGRDYYFDITPVAAGTVHKITATEAIVTKDGA